MNKYFDECKISYDSVAAEFQSAANYMAKKGLKGNDGDALPLNMSKDCVEYINFYKEEFQETIRLHAYANAMNL